MVTSFLIGAVLVLLFAGIPALTTIWWLDREDTPVDVIERVSKRILLAGAALSAFCMILISRMG